MSESLRNDGRIWVPAKLEDAKQSVKERKNQQNYLKKRLLPREKYPSLGIFVPRDVVVQ
jgi:succinate dehydrogenase / fumarate reductase flavoprotein subunit